MEKDKNKVSVIIPCASGHVKYIPECLSSCLKAKPPPDEVIIVDDCSNPPVNPDIGKPSYAVAPPIVKIWRLTEHQGRSFARNFGVRFVGTCKWLYFLDADDFLEPTAILDFKRIANNPNIDLIYADYDYINQGGERIRVAKRNKSAVTPPRHNLINIGMFVKRERFLKVGGFDEDMSIAEYWDFYLRYTANPKIGIYKYNFPFFVARQSTSILPNAQEMMDKASLKMQALIRGGYYRYWRKI